MISPDFVGHDGVIGSRSFKLGAISGLCQTTDDQQFGIEFSGRQNHKKIVHIMGQCCDQMLGLLDIGLMQHCILAGISSNKMDFFMCLNHFLVLFDHHKRMTVVRQAVGGLSTIATKTTDQCMLF